MSIPAAWRVAAPGGLARRSWPDEPEAVVYDGATGRTHRVDGISHALLAILEDGPRSIVALAEHFAGWFEDCMDRGARERYLDDALHHLQAVDLVTPVR